MEEKEDETGKTGDIDGFCTEVIGSRFLALDLGLRVVGVAWADGSLFAQGFSANALHAFAMPSGKHRLCNHVHKLLLAYRINVLVVGVPPSITFTQEVGKVNRNRNSRQIRKQILALAGRLRNYFSRQGMVADSGGDFLKLREQKNRKSVEKDVGASGIQEKQEKRIEVEFFDESFSTYAVKSEARFARWGAKNAGERGNPARKALGNKKKSRANLDSLAAVEILTAFLNSKIGEKNGKCNEKM